MNNLAPIVLFVYNRPEHSRKTLEALTHNLLADQSKLYIFVDGLKKNASAEQHDNWLKTKALIREKKWCAEVIIHENDYNKDLAQSIADGVSEIVNRYGRVIVLEDDLITSVGFLTYMNQALEKYEHTPNVYSVSAYTLPADYEELKESTFFLKYVCSWGWGTWREKWKVREADSKKLLAKFQNREQISEFNVRHYYTYEILLKQSEGKIQSWAVGFYGGIFWANGLTLFPKISLVQNIGFDNTGVNCTEENFYELSPVTDFCEITPIEVQENLVARRAIEKSFQKQYHPTIWQRIKRKIRTKIGLDRI
jgi:hypothetical protein